MSSRSASTHAGKRREVSVHVQRARKLLFGGLLGGSIAAVICLVGFGIGSGVGGFRSAVLASAMVLFFYVGGQLVMVRFAEAGARLLLAVAMASYTTRVVVLGLVLLIFNSNADSVPWLQPMAVFVTTIAVVVGWLLVEVWVFFRLRVQVYDEEYVSPSEVEDGQ